MSSTRMYADEGQSWFSLGLSNLLQRLQGATPKKTSYHSPYVPSIFTILVSVSIFVVISLLFLRHAHTTQLRALSYLFVFLLISSFTLAFALKSTEVARAASKTTKDKKPHQELKLTWEELSKHNTEGDYLLAIRGKIYDVSEFIRRHPGGKDVLKLGSGRDCTQLFDSYHPFKTYDILPKYEVGELVSYELPHFREPSKFYKTLKERVEKYFQDSKQDPKYAPWMWVRYTLIFSTIIASWYLQCFVYPTSLAALCILALPLGFACALVGLMPMHDTSHFAITHHPRVWRYFGALHDFFNGASYLVWEYQHTMGHHAYTNIDEADPDILTNVDDVRRIKTSQKWYSRYIGQHVYVPVLYALLGIKTRIQDVSILFEGKNGLIRINPMSFGHLFRAIAGKSFFLLYRVIVPLTVMPVSYFFISFIISDIISSYWLALTFQANHVVQDVLWPSPDEKQFVDMDWAEMQVQTTQDYAHDSWFWNVFSGGLNHQTIHHIFPNVNQYYYPEISPILQQTAKEFNIPYFYKPTYWEALASHLNWLKFLGLGHDLKPDDKKSN